jgi:hypothetical protein
MSGHSSRFPAAALACALAVTLAGCTLGSIPNPTAKPLTAAQRCTPKTATIQWFPALDNDDTTGMYFVPVQVQVFDYSKGAGALTKHNINVFPKTRVKYSATSAKHWSSVPNDVWLQTLITSVGLTGQVLPGFGRPHDISDAVIPPDVHSGISLVVLEQPSQIVPFAIECKGQDSVVGRITGIDQGGILSLHVTCGDTNARPSDGAAWKRALALAPKYCKPTK